MTPEPVRVPGKVPPPRIVHAPAPPSPAGADEQYMAGLRVRRQADHSWKVFDLAGRHVATIHSDGSLAHTGPRRTYGPVGPALMRESLNPDCLGTECMRTNSSDDPVSALGSSLLFSGLVALAGRRVERDVEVNRKTRTEIDQATAAFRVEVAREHYLAAYCERLHALQRDLVRTWRIADSRARKRTLFEVFDGVAARFPAAHARVPAGALADLGTLHVDAVDKAREIVVLFVRARLPKGSRGAYSRRELRALNRTRRGIVAFEPYAAPAEP